MAQALTVDELFTELEDYISASMQILEKEEYLDLKGLDSKVATICAEVLRMPKETAKEYAARMDMMSRQLDLLKKVMEEHKDRIAKQLGGVDNSARAHKAYTRSDAMVPPEENQ